MKETKMEKGLIIFLIVFLISLPFWWKNAQNSLEDFFFAFVSQPLQNPTLVKSPSQPNLEFNAKSVISVKVDKEGSQKIIFKKYPKKILPIASLTKLMTAVILLENPKYYNFSKVVTISKKAAAQENVPVFGNLKEGDKLSVKELLDLMLVYSSNDAAFALTEVLETNNFVKKMNEKAEELGLENTHFVNPTGLDPDNLNYNSETRDYFNVSTARDLVKLTQYILKEHPLIFETSIQEPLYSIPDGIFDLFTTQEVVGGKTGYTDEAGGCILFITKNEKGDKFINLILGAPSSAARIEEMQKLVNWLNIQ